MRAKGWIGAAFALLLLAGGGYYVFDQLTGNHVEIREVFDSGTSGTSGSAAGAAGGSAAPGSSGSTAAGAQPQQQPASQPQTQQSPVKPALDKTWSIQPESKVYLSVTTSRETVNIEFPKVEGTWTIQSDKPEAMKAEAKVNLAALTSGNAQRDGHVKGTLYLDTAQHSVASFAMKGVEGWTGAWTDGKAVSFTIKGTLTVKGIAKDVTIAAEGLKDGELLKVKGTTKVTFNDFGMKNPHAVVLDTQNDLLITLQLVWIPLV